MILYIDPGTGSMLFTVLIGILGTSYYVLRMLWVKLRFVLSGGKNKEVGDEKIPLVIFSDHKRYWNIFEPICRMLNEKNVDVTYMTASPDDPALNCGLEHVNAQFIGEGNKAFAKLNFLKANILLSTTPGLDVYQWKRSKDIDFYVHIMHAAAESTGYRMFGLDYYDAVMVSGQYMIDDQRALEEKRGLSTKEMVSVGIPYMDEMATRLIKAGNVVNDEKIVLLAPSWGASSILNKFGNRILDVLIDTGYHIIVRPHPQSFTADKEMMEKLMTDYPENDKFQWNRDNDNFEVLRKSDILISDFSGVVFDFSLVYDKPVIYADTEFDNSPYDASWLDTPYWTFTALPRIGEKLTEDNMDNLKEIIDACIDDPKYAAGRDEVRNETWEHKGEGTENVVNYLIAKLEEIKQKKADQASEDKGDDDKTPKSKDKKNKK